MKHKTPTSSPGNNKINPILYHFYLRLRAKLGARIVHRRNRRSNNAIEIILTAPLFKLISGRLNTLPEANQWNYWIMMRPQRGKHALYRNYPVFQLFLTPVHPRKKHEARIAAENVSFEPIRPQKRKKTTIPLHMSKKNRTFASDFKTRSYEKTTLT